MAATLGHGERARFWRVALPLAAPGIQAGLVLTWLRAFGEYGAIVILAYHPFTLSVYTYTQFSAGGLADTLAPTALALVVAALAIALGRLPLRPPVRRRRLGAALPTTAAPPPVAAARCASTSTTGWGPSGSRWPTTRALPT